MLKVPNPWNPHFALPSNVRAESSGRGTITTKQMTRKTFGHVPRGWDGCGYDIPKYIMDEHHGRGAINTMQRRRRTIPLQLPDDEPLALTLPGEVYALDGITIGTATATLFGFAPGAALFLKQRINKFATVVGFAPMKETDVALTAAEAERLKDVLLFIYEQTSLKDAERKKQTFLVEVAALPKEPPYTPMQIFAAMRAEKIMDDLEDLIEWISAGKIKIKRKIPWLWVGLGVAGAYFLATRK
jgi:hypothetical protein